MASPFLQGFQVGANTASDAMNRNLRMQELQSQRQMRMLQERNLAEQLQLRMEERNLAIQERADMAKAITAAQEATQPFHVLQGPDGEMGVPNPNPMTQEQAAMNFVLPVVGKYQPDKVPQFLQSVALAEHRRALDRPFTPSESTLPSGTKVVSTSPNSVQVLQQPGMQSSLGRELEDLQTLEKSGNTAAVTAFKEMQARRDSSKGEIVTIGQDGSVNISRGIPLGDLTQSQRGVAKQQADKLVDTATRVGEIIPLSDKLFGPVNAAKSFVVDRGLSNLVPGLAEGQRIEGRTKAGLVIESLIRSLSEGQGQLSNKDIERLKSKFPELNDPQELMESPARAKVMLKAIQKELARDAFERVKTLGQPIDKRTLRLVDPAVLVQEFRAGRITADELRNAIDATAYPDDAEALLKNL